VEAIRKYHGGPILAVFGNNEYAPDFPRYRAGFPFIRFLHDEATELFVGGHTISVVGTLGSLEKPTVWQARHVPNIHEEYASRVEKVRQLLADARGDVRILLMHYAPTFVTMEGEPQWYWNQLGSRRYEEVILATRPDVVLHGHIHKGKPVAFLRRAQRTLGDFEGDGQVPVYNIAFAERHEITLLELTPSRRRSL
jgi:Icc-related predicted phosphoesterase